MKRILLTLPCCAAAWLLGAGCSTEHGAYLPQKTDQFNQEVTAKFVTLDPGAQRSVTCSSLQEGRTPDGRLTVAANIRNRENRRIEVQVNCVFKDEQGFMTEETSFSSLILTENETQTVKFESLNAQAKKYTVRVRQAR
ncbi:MAG: YcfL family protein [Verrucomicrobia bacterium]|nr:YcfL family protein [Verrucomicrobiota bacterium]